MTDAGKMSLKLVEKEGIMLRNEWEERGVFLGKLRVNRRKSRREYE